MDISFQLFLCSSSPHLAVAVDESGIDGVIVEWENSLLEPSDGSDCLPVNSVSPDKVNALQQVRHATNRWVICRLNAFGAHTRTEIETAIDNGADEIWLPKISTLKEAEAVFAQVGRRCAVGIVIETEAALEIADKLSALPIAHIHLGVNDLAEALGKPHHLCALMDGTIEQLFKKVGSAVPYGCIGLTVPERQHPIPSRLLMGELMRLNCRFGLLRGSFLKDTTGQNLPQEVAKIRKALRELSARTEDEKWRDQQALYRHIKALLSVTAPNT
jgi:hypothetical protein